MTTKRLDETVDGDVFYLTGYPRELYLRCAPGWDGYQFTMMGRDEWRTQDEVGLPGAEVVVVHNTRAHLAETVARSGGS